MMMSGGNWIVRNHAMTTPHSRGYPEDADKDVRAPNFTVPMLSDPTSPDSLLLRKYSDRNPLTHPQVKGIGARRRKATGILSSLVNRMLQRV